MKILYQYAVPVSKFVKEETKTSDGILIKDVEKIVDQAIGIKSPSRVEKDEGDMVYSLRLSECIKAGMLTKAQLTKEFSELGGLWSKNENQEYLDLCDEYQKIGNDFSSAQIRYSSKPDKANKNILAIHYQQLLDIYTRIRQFEEHKSEIFNETAEVKARNRALLWYVCNLTYFLKESGEKDSWIPLVIGKTFEEKLDSYDSILDDGEEWQRAALDKAMLIISLWYSGKISSQEDMQLIEELINSQNETELELESLVDEDEEDEEIVLESEVEVVEETPVVEETVTPVEVKPKRSKKVEA